MATDPVCGMNVNPDDALKLSHRGVTYYFCSLRCLERFKAEHGIEDAVCLAPAAKPRHALLRNKTVMIALFLILLCLLAEFIPLIRPFRFALVMYFRMIWWAILLGLFLGGVIDHFIPRQYISAALATSKRRSILHAVILGFFMSVCSHGILALAIQLHKKGAPTPCVVAFLMASPWANLPLTIMLIGFFGVVPAAYIVFVAIVVAVITGFIYQFLESKGWVELNKNTFQLDKDFSVRQDFVRRWQDYSWSAVQFKHDLIGVWQGVISLANMVLWWILIGMGLASLAGAYIPQDFFYQYMGPSALGLLITLAVATVLEVCSEGTAPLAFEIFRQTGALGNSFVFLMAGVATDYTEIGLLWHNVGRRTAIWLPVVTVPQIILFGVIANIIF